MRLVGVDVELAADAKIELDGGRTAGFDVHLANRSQLDRGNLGSRFLRKRGDRKDYRQ